MSTLDKDMSKKPPTSLNYVKGHRRSNKISQDPKVSHTLTQATKSHWLQLFLNVIYAAFIMYLLYIYSYTTSYNKDDKCQSGWKSRFSIAVFGHFILFTITWCFQLYYTRHFVFNQNIDNTLRMLYMLCVFIMIQFTQLNMDIAVNDTVFKRVFVWGSLSVGTIVLVIILIMCIKNLQSSVVVTPFDKVSQHSQIFHISGYLLSNISWSCYWYVLLYVPKDAKYYVILKKALNASKILFWCFGVLSFYCVFLLKVHRTFQGTIYQVSYYVFVIWGFLLFCISVVYTSFIVDIYADFDDDKFNNIAFPSLILLNIITGFSLLYVFRSNLYKFALKMKPTNADAIRTTELQRKQLGFYQIIEWNTLLGGISVIVIPIFFYFEWIERYTAHHCEWEVWSYFLSARMVLRQIIMIVDVLCVYLSSTMKGRRKTKQN